LRISGLVKLHRQLFTLSHLAKIRKIRAHDWHSIRTGKMRYPAATGRRGVRHYRDGRTLKQVGQPILMHVTGELDGMIPGALLLH
jgi:hypothetical protein